MLRFIVFVPNDIIPVTSPMEPLSLTILFVIGIIGWLVNALALVANAPFSPLVFPIIPMLAILAGIFLYFHLRSTSTPPPAADELTPKQKLLQQVWTYLPYLILLPGVILLIFLPSLQFGYHGPFHSAYAYQIMNRGIPPENATLPGYPVNDYWPYHALLAILSHFFSAPPPFVSMLLNITMLAVAFTLLNVLWKALIRDAKPAPALFIIFILLSSNLLYFVNWQTIKWLVGIPSLKSVAVWLSSVDYRLELQFFHFLNFSAFPVGVAFFLGCLAVAERILREGLTLKDGALFVIFIASALLYHATTGVFLLAVLTPTLLFLFFLDADRRASFLDLWRGRRYMLVGLILLGILILLPVGLFILQSSQAMPAKTTVEWFSSADLASIFAQTYPVLVFFIWGMVKAWKEKQAFLLFVSLAALWGFLLAIIIKLPDNNEYKFIFLASICVNLIAALQLQTIASGRGVWPKALITLLVLATLSKVGYDSWRFYDMYTRRHKDVEIVYKDAHVLLQQKEYEPFNWVQENTPPDTVIIQAANSKDWNYGYFTERLPYVVMGHIYNDGIPETAIRQKLIDTLYDQSLSVEARIAALQEIIRSMPDRPLVLLYPYLDVFAEAMEETFGVKGIRFTKDPVIYFLPPP